MKLFNKSKSYSKPNKCTMNKKGLIILLFASLIAVVFFFNDVVFKLNTTFFASGGDGLKAYYGAIYHNEYDDNGYRMNGMNYPYGEMVFFTGCQPLLANTVRWIDQHLVECSHYMVGIMNFFMLLSIVLAAIFLFLIFKRLKMPNWYAIVVSLGITFLSPQIARLGGHFSLSWMLWIPLEIYMLMLLYEKLTWMRSLLFGLLAFLSGIMHLYFLAFAAFLLLAFWTDRYLISRTKIRLVDGLHFVLQLLLPLLVIQLIMGAHDNIADRTAHPWGFYAYRAYPGSVLLPVHKWYVPYLSDLGLVRKYSWEALSYVGLVASAGFFVLFGRWIYRVTRSKNRIYTLSGNHLLDVMFWASFAALLFSFGLPFILGLEKLRTFFGPVGQLRAVGRFAWLFYYVINIIVFVKLYRYYQVKKIISKRMSYILMLVVLAVLLFEAWNVVRPGSRAVNHQMTALTDEETVEYHQYLKGIEPEAYQAIMPLPYFHVGSESFWLESECNMAQHTFIASLKTGLPTNAVMLSRTSLEQSYKNYELVLAPWKQYRVLDDLPDDRPLLLMVAKCNKLSVHEQFLVDHAQHLASANEFDWYALPLDSLRSIPEKVNLPERYVRTMTDPESLIQPGMDLQAGDVPGNEFKVQLNDQWKQLFETGIQADITKKLYLRFWLKDYDHDMVARTRVRIFQSTPEHATLEELYTDLWRHILTINEEWALIEIELQPKEVDQIIKFQLSNSELSGNKIVLKEIALSQLSL